MKALKEAGKLRFLSSASQYDFFVRVNGKTEQLEDDTIIKMERSFIPGAMSWEISEGRPKVITRMRPADRRNLFKHSAGSALQDLLECLTGEPAWLKTALEKAVAEYSEEEPKTASEDPFEQE